MRARRLVSIAALGLLAGAAACESFSGSPADPTSDGDAAVDAGTVSDAAGLDDANADVVAPDAMPEAGALLWEIHGDPGVQTLAARVGLGASQAGWSFGVGLHAPPVTLGPTAFDASGVGVLAFDHAGGLRTKSAFPDSTGFNIEATAIDRVGDIYVVGSRVAPKANNSKSAFVAKLRGDGGQALWGVTYSVDGADANLDYTSNALAVATNGLNVAVAIRFNLQLPFTRASNGSIGQLEQPGVPTADDTAIFFLDGGTGRMLWKKQIGGGGVQAPASLEIADDGSVLAGGFTGSASVTVDGTEVIPATPAQGVTRGWLLRFDGNEPHDVLRKDALTPSPDATVVVNAARLMPGGDVVACGLMKGTQSISGLGVKPSGANDGWIARLGKENFAWIHSFGGAKNDDCSALDVDSEGNVVFAANHESDLVSVAGHDLTGPLNASSTATSVLKLDGAGQLVWAFDVDGNARIARVAVAPNDDVLYTGLFFGRADYGVGPIEAPDAAVPEAAAFVVRRAP